METSAPPDREKIEQYMSLVAKRKKCRLCSGVTNPLSEEGRVEKCWRFGDTVFN